MWDFEEMLPMWEYCQWPIHILSIRHSRMLVTMDDTAWN